MLSLDVRRLSVQRAFWSGAARAFDLFGLFSGFGRPLTGEAALRADAEAVARDWQVVMDDLALAWKIVEPQLKSEREQLL